MAPMPHPGRGGPPRCTHHRWTTCRGRRLWSTAGHRRLRSMAPSLSGLATLVSDRVTAALHEHTAPFPGQAGMDERLGAGEALLGGGIRLRAAFCTAGWTAFSPEPVVAGSAPVLAGSALELFQGAALAHDDLMDGSHTRRGLPAVHRRMAAEHTANGWQGDPERHGAAGAILLGDLLLTLSSVELDRARDLVDAAASRRARATWDLMTAEVAVGQYLDVRSQVLPWSSQVTTSTSASPGPGSGTRMVSTVAGSFLALTTTALTSCMEAFPFDDADAEECAG